MTDPLVAVHEGKADELLRDLPPESIDCVIADPPYGVTNFKWDQWPGEMWITQARRVLKPHGTLWVFGSMRTFMKYAYAFDRGWRTAQEIVWEKQNGTNFHNDRFRRVHEIVVQFYPKGRKWAEIYTDPQFTQDATRRTIRKKPRPSQWLGRTAKVSTYISEDGGPRMMRSVIRMRNEHGRSLHPTQKPISLVQHLVRYSCPPGGIVLDPFAGSGTTGLAALNEGRRAVLIEQEAEFAEIARRRIREITEFELT